MDPKVIEFRSAILTILNDPETRELENVLFLDEIFYRIIRRMGIT